jgi:prepilin-type N-terminal cleavage/methylation domain-containing protein
MQEHGEDAARLQTAAFLRPEASSALAGARACKGRRGGFTLVELIVVIVIIGILAAIAVPSLVGYIDKARSDGAKIEGASVERALQGIMTEGKSHVTGTGDNTEYLYSDASGSVVRFSIEEGVVIFKFPVDFSTPKVIAPETAITNLTGIKFATGSNLLTGVKIDPDTYSVTNFVAKLANGRTVTYANGDYTVAPTA